jgi:hypothetical protein
MAHVLSFCIPGVLGLFDIAAAQSNIQIYATFSTRQTLSVS